TLRLGRKNVAFVGEELRASAFGFKLRADPLDGLAENLDQPGRVERLFGSRPFGLFEGLPDGNARRLQRNDLHPAAALQSMQRFVLMADEATQDDLEISAERSELRSIPAESIVFQQPREEHLGEILGVFVRFS